MEQLTKEQEILKLLFKDFSRPYNSRNISKVVDMTPAGAFKILKGLEKRSIVEPQRIGKAIIYSLNLKNPLARREIEMVLTMEAEKFRHWVAEFRFLEDRVFFAVLFGSVLRNEAEARDIDLLLVAEKIKKKEIDKFLEIKKKILSKPLHLLFQTPEDFAYDIRTKNKASLEILRTGIVLFGQEKIDRLLGEVI